jgi:hypothetical protein
MAWLRLDDGYTSNSKIAQLGNAEFRVWLRLLCHCARSHDPSVDAAARNEVVGLTRKAVQRFADLGLLDVVGDNHEVHDWTHYLPKDATNVERQARWRARRAADNGHAWVPPTLPTDVTKGVT